MFVGVFNGDALIDHSRAPIGFESVRVPARRKASCFRVYVGIEAQVCERQGQGGLPCFLLGSHNRVTSFNRIAVIRQVVVLLIIFDDLTEQATKLF